MKQIVNADKKIFFHSISVFASLKGNDNYCGQFFQMAICWLSVWWYIYKGYCAIYKIYSLWHMAR